MKNKLIFIFFFLYLLPEIGGAQQIALNSPWILEFGIRKESKKICSGKDARENEMWIRYLPIGSDTFYRNRNIKAIKIYDSSNKISESILLDRNGEMKISEKWLSNGVIRKIIVNDTFYTVTSIIYDGALKQAIDSIRTTIISYKKLDTTITLIIKKQYSYKSGLYINERNRALNEKYYNKLVENDCIPKVYLKEKLGVLYSNRKFYLTMKKLNYEFENQIGGKNSNHYISEHPFVLKNQKNGWVKYFVSGERFEEPDIVLQPFLHCGSSANSNRDEETNKQYWYKNSKGVYTQNSKGLNDSFYTYYFPPATKEELKEINKLGEKQRTLSVSNNLPIPSPIERKALLFTFHYEYYNE